MHISVHVCCVFIYIHTYLCTVVAVLKKHYDGLCNCLPKDSTVTLNRIKQHPPAAGHVRGVEEQLLLLPPDHANAMIIVLFIKHLTTDVDVLSFCDIMENVVDNSTSESFIHTLRSGKCMC